MVELYYPLTAPDTATLSCVQLWSSVQDNGGPDQEAPNTPGLNFLTIAVHNRANVKYDWCSDNIVTKVLIPEVDNDIQYTLALNRKNNNCNIAA